MKKKALSIFEQALVDCVLEEFKDVPAEDEIEMAFSPAFQVNAQKLIRKAENNHWSSGKVFLRKVAIVALISAILLLTACSIPAVREAIIEFFFKDVGTHYEFTYDPEDIANAPKAIETVYCPTYIPEGYTEAMIDYHVAAVTCFWITEDGRFLNYEQVLLPEDPLSGESGHINSEGAEAEWITVNNCKVLRIEDKEWLSYVWVTNEYEFSIMCQKPISEDEIQKVFDSIRIDEDAIIFGAE